MEQEGTNNLYTVKEDDLWNEEDVNEISMHEKVCNNLKRFK